MITQESVDALRDLRQSIKALTVACVGYAGPRALVHIAYDKGAQTRLSREEDELLSKLKSYK